jgi:hypothetical protein
MSWPPSKWQGRVAFISIMQFIVVVIALLYARRQQREVMRSRSLNAAKQMLDEISTPTGIVNLTQQETKLATWGTGMHVSSSG